MAQLLPNNATELERAIEQAIGQRLDTVAVPHGDLLSPDRCPSHLLPWLAWANSVDVWRDDWPDNVKRQVIRNAPEIHRKKGTVTAVKLAVAAFGAGLNITEWFQQTPPGTPYTFSVTYTPSDALPNTAQFQLDVASAIERSKPLRAAFSLRAGISSAGQLGVGGALRAASLVRLNLQEG